jgi:transposase InsO family protein
MEHAADIHWPSRATFAAILKRKQLSRPPRRRRAIRPYGKPLERAQASNDVWCIDYKGQFKLGNGRYCYPLTVTDEFSRYVLVCDGFESIRGDDVQRSLLAAFEKYGLPRVIRSDNGSPFASSRSAFGWSRFTPWLAQLGVDHERIEPAHPEQNGRHERMHRTLKAETTRPADKTLFAQQVRFDAFCETFNDKRPHEALGDVPPATVYEPSPRRLPKSIAPLSYPLHDLERRVLRGGKVRMPQGHRFVLSVSLEGHTVGLRELDGARWLVTFASHDLGIYDESTKRFLSSSEEKSKEKEPKRA